VSPVRDELDVYIPEDDILNHKFCLKLSTVYTIAIVQAIKPLIGKLSGENVSQEAAFCGECCCSSSSVTTTRYQKSA
jgi:hypothetical protein